MGPYAAESPSHLSSRNQSPGVCWSPRVLGRPGPPGLATFYVRLLREGQVLQPPTSHRSSYLVQYERPGHELPVSRGILRSIKTDYRTRATEKRSVSPFGDYRVGPIAPP